MAKDSDRLDTENRSGSVAKRKGAYHHGDLRRALIDVAREIIVSEGPQSLSLRAVARRAKVSTAAPYRHFPSRDALLAAVAQEGFETLSAKIREATAAFPNDSLARLREAGVAYVCFADEHPAHYQVMFMPGLMEGIDEPGYQTAGAESFCLLVDAIRDCQADGLIRQEDPLRLALVAWSGVHGFASLKGNGEVARLGFGSERVEDMARMIADALVAGVLL